MTGPVRRALRGCAAGAVLIAGAALLLAALPAAALTPEEVEQRVLAITDDLRCPTCQALSVKDSEASFSAEIRDKVQRMVQEGQSDDQIKAYFVARYGEWILRAPSKTGIGLVVWVLPLLALAGAGGALTWSIVRRGRTRGPAAAAGNPPASAAPASGLTPEQRERIQSDLKRYEEED
jgi:cytochrome c-type biogenesis protein CcmH